MKENYLDLNILNNNFFKLEQTMQNINIKIIILPPPNLSPHRHPNSPILHYHSQSHYQTLPSPQSLYRLLSPITYLTPQTLQGPQTHRPHRHPHQNLPLPPHCLSHFLLSLQSPPLSHFPHPLSLQSPQNHYFMCLFHHPSLHPLFPSQKHRYFLSYPVPQNSPHRTIFLAILPNQVFENLYCGLFLNKNFVSKNQFHRKILYFLESQLPWKSVPSKSRLESLINPHLGRILRILAYQIPNSTFYGLCILCLQ